MENNGRWLFLFIRAVPCTHFCKHCLFAPSKRFKVMSYENIVEVIRPFIDLSQSGQAPYQHIAVHVGDCALNHDDLPALVYFLRAHNIEGWQSVPADGFQKRTHQGWLSYLRALKQAGTEILEFSLYGEQDTHDWFAGVKGSYEAIHSLAEVWHEVGGTTLWGVFVHKRNLTEVPDLCLKLREKYQAECSVDTWTFLGWGARIENLRIEKQDVERLDVSLANDLSSLKTEREWMYELCESDALPFEQTPRVIRLAIDASGQVRIPYTTAESGLDGIPCGNVFSISAAEVIEQWQRAYQAWLGVYPAIGYLCQRYGDKSNEKLYDKQSVVRKWCAAFEATQKRLTPAAADSGFRRSETRRDLQSG